MPVSINNNLMAANVAKNLYSHYGRLATSVQRLSSGLRINSAADDAAGLSIRELMRADVAALNQGMRNANDAISMIQVADGALGVIDEKLIRMKELAEQAATGTYSSTQRLISESEYQAMASEIDRIARATDFNGIKLLDGSLAGAHDGKGLNSTGKMKIHFGAANDSAEDYYYVEIGDCTAAALGVGAGSVQNGQQITYIKVETTEESQASFTIPDKVDVFVGPDGNNYYKIDDMYCRYISNPYGSQVTDESIIAQFTRKQHEIRTTTRYDGYEDPDTGLEYYLGNGSYTSDPYDPVGKRLDAGNPGDADILNRLVRSPTGKTVRVEINWKVWSDPHGQYFYSYDNGNTFVPDPASPSTGVLDNNDPDDAAVINDFEVILGEYAPDLPPVRVDYKVWTDPVYNSTYYSLDGVNFLMSTSRPNDFLDPVRQKYIIDRLEMALDYTFTHTTYNCYTDPATGTIYYTPDNMTWFVNPRNPSAGSININNPSDALIIANLQAMREDVSYDMTCAAYQDTANNNALYYSWDYGRTFFSDIADPAGSSFSANDPTYAGLVANFNRISSTVEINQVFTTYYDEVTGTKYYTSDGGKMYYLVPHNPSTFVDPSAGNNAVILGRLKLYPKDETYAIHYYSYIDPETGQRYYAG